MSGIERQNLPADGLVRLTLDLGRGNILDVAAMRALRARAAELAGEPALRGLLVDHAGPHFSYGASVEDHLPERAAEMLGEFHGLARELVALDLPTIAAVRGQCLGGGLELALLADLVFAAPDARFGQPEIELAVFAPVASLLLPHRAGSRLSSDLLLSGRSIGAEEALAAGLVNGLADDPGAAALDWAREHLAPKSAAALRRATRAARLHWSIPFLRDLDRVESLYLDDLMTTEDAAEGLAAFLEKRSAGWKHR